MLWGFKPYPQIRVRAGVEIKKDLVDNHGTILKGNQLESLYI